MNRLKQYWRAKRVEYGFDANGYDERIVGAAVAGALCWGIAIAAVIAAASCRSWTPVLWFIAGWAARSAVPAFTHHE